MLGEMAALLYTSKRASQARALVVEMGIRAMYRQLGIFH